MCLSCPCSPQAQLSQQGWEAGPHFPVEQHLQQHPHWSFACSLSLGFAQQISLLLSAVSPCDKHGAAHKQQPLQVSCPGQGGQASPGMF